MEQELVWIQESIRNRAILRYSFWGKGEICREGEEIITFFYISPDWRPERKANMFSTCLEKIKNS